MDEQEYQEQPHQEEYPEEYSEEQYVSESNEQYDLYEEEFEEIENYVEINEEVTLSFNEWMYDAIINKTLKEAELDYAHDLIDLLNESKRDASGFLSLIHLESKDYRLLSRYMSKALKNSANQEKRVYIRKAHNQFLREFQELINVMVRDERYTMY